MSTYGKAERARLARARAHARVPTSTPSTREMVSVECVSTLDIFAKSH